MAGTGENIENPTGAGAGHKNDHEFDIMRDSWVRYLGYANELGESFKAFIPRQAYYGSYVVASGYVVADAVDKGTRAYHKAEKETLEERRKHTILAVAETGVWQAFASVIIPGFVINRLCATTAWTQARYLQRVPLPLQKSITTAIGLAAIPFIIHPIDRSVDYAMERAFTPYVRRWVLKERKD
eukprot:comp27038_c0_seq1/m.47136 comp27038_c0_seq1/g.47136  ORF comp27038_c0_seq1/g.47136 comp27038_c0_seq1/m.47136 type:complete len:184 (-) comp27038_c0_seq1:125-676(-)